MLSQHQPARLRDLFGRALLLGGLLTGASLATADTASADFWKSERGDWKKSSKTWSPSWKKKSFWAWKKSKGHDAPAEPEMRNVPELDASAGSQALALLVGGTFVLVSRRRKKALVD